LEDVTRGLRYLHKCGIVHGDLKGTNILIKNGATPQACISDFGFSTLTPTMSFVMPASMDECKGTWSHMAPELLHPEKFGLRDGRVSKQADIYAFGMVVYEVLTGRFPF
ncbi:kinase-like protein, partial [Thelephora ganbajun]